MKDEFKEFKEFVESIERIEVVIRTATHVIVKETHFENEFMMDKFVRPAFVAYKKGKKK